MNRVLLVLVVVLLSVECRSSAASTDATPDRFFGLTNFWEIHLTLPSENWAALVPPEPQRPVRQPDGPRPPGPGMFERDYPWSTATFACDGQVLTNVGVRFKGNSSFNMGRGTGKLPFKLDFDRGAKGRTFHGLEEFFLNNNVNDGTQFREALAYDAFRRAGLPAPRTTFAKVHLTVTGERTNEYLGLYTVVEAVEGDFLKTRFGTKKGLLVKPERLPSLEYLGEDWSAYTNRYNPKTDVKADDTRRFIALARLIAQADDATLARELPARLDVDGFLRFIALNAVLANYDSFLGNGHNYYLFQPRGGGKAAFIPWDLNEAFGGHPGAGPRRAQAEFSVLRPGAQPNRLLNRVLANTNWAAAYHGHVATLLTNAFDPARLRNDAGRIARVTQEAVFTESSFAKAGFQRSALGQTNVALPDRRPEFRRARPGEEPRLDPQREAEREGRPPGGGDFPPRRDGPPRGMMDDMGFAEWVTLRAANVADELAGNRTGTNPQMMRGPGGPGGPRRPGQPQLGGPGGLVPPPDGQRPRRPPDRQ